MHIELLTIGDEILRGAIVNSNATFLSVELAKRGFIVSRQTSIADQPSDIFLGLKEILARADIVIATGGLGPTHDDVTKDIVAKFFDSSMGRDGDVYKDLKKRFGNQLNILQHQANVPKKAKVFLNRVGTAPALVFEEKNKLVIFLPGVPEEMRTFFEHDIGPFLSKKYGYSEIIHTDTHHFCLLSESEIDPTLEGLKNVKSGVYPHFGKVSVQMHAKEPRKLAAASKVLISKFDKHLFESEDGLIEQAVQTWMVGNNKSLAVAESCTGGRLASKITAQSGASDYFRGGIVCYTNEVKEKFLGVPTEILKKEGAVSRECVEAMLDGVFEKFDTDYAIAISGIAGPKGGSAAKPVGTVYVGIAEKGGRKFVANLHATGNREKIIELSCGRALGHLFRYLKYNLNPFGLA